MKNMIRVGMAGAAFGLAFTAMTATADESLSTRAPVAENTTEGVSSPNVWVCSLPQAAYWGQNGGIRAFSIATTSANKGNINSPWLNIFSVPLIKSVAATYNGFESTSKEFSGKNFFKNPIYAPHFFYSHLVY